MIQQRSHCEFFYHLTTDLQVYYFHHGFSDFSRVSLWKMTFVSFSKNDGSFLIPNWKAWLEKTGGSGSDGLTPPRLAGSVGAGCSHTLPLITQTSVSRRLDRVAIGFHPPAGLPGPFGELCIWSEAG